MRRNIICLLMLGLLGTALSAQSPDVLNFPQPQCESHFDSFTRNYMSTSAMGRHRPGHSREWTTCSKSRRLHPDKASLHLEMLVKPRWKAIFTRWPTPPFTTA